MIYITIPSKFLKYDIMLKQQIELMNSDDYEPEAHLYVCLSMIEEWLEWSAEEVINMLQTDGEAISLADDMKDYYKCLELLNGVMNTYPSDLSAEYITSCGKELIKLHNHKFNNIVNQTTLENYVMSKPIQSILKEMGHNAYFIEVDYPI
jgi:hypothetical protein